MINKDKQEMLRNEIVKKVNNLLEPAKNIKLHEFWYINEASYLLETQGADEMVRFSIEYGNKYLYYAEVGVRQGEKAIDIATDVVEDFFNTCFIGGYLKDSYKQFSLKPRYRDDFVEIQPKLSSGVIKGLHIDYVNIINNAQKLNLDVVVEKEPNRGTNFLPEKYSCIVFERKDKEFQQKVLERRFEKLQQKRLQQKNQIEKGTER